jgi:hypothetical protein
VNRGFADLRVEPLHHVARGGCPSRIRTSVHGSKVRCPTTRRRGSGRCPRETPGVPGARKWSGRRDSNPRPSPWQGDALPTEPLPLDDATTLRWCREPGSNWRHRDFQSRALPTELSRPDGQPGSVARRRGRGYHGPPTGLNLPTPRQARSPGRVSGRTVRPAAESSRSFASRFARVSGRFALTIQ